MYKRPVIIEANDLAEGIFMSSGEVFAVVGGDVAEEKISHPEVSATGSLSYYDETSGVSCYSISWTLDSADSPVENGMKFICQFDNVVNYYNSDSPEVKCEKGDGTNVLTLDVNMNLDNGNITLYVKGVEPVPCSLESISTECY